MLGSLPDGGSSRGVSTSCLHRKRRADANSVPPRRHSFHLALLFFRCACFFTVMLINADGSANGVPGSVRILPASALIFAPDRLPEIVKRPPLSRKISEESEREPQGQSAPHWPFIRLICRLVHGGQSALPQVSHPESHEEQIENITLRRKLPGQFGRRSTARLKVPSCSTDRLVSASARLRFSTLLG